MLSLVSRSLALVAFSATLALPVTAHAVTTDAQMAAFTQMEQLSASELSLQRDGAYALCLGMAGTPKGQQAVLGDSAWTRDGEYSDEYFEYWYPASGTESLYVELQLMDHGCSVWSQETSLQSAKAQVTDLFKRANIELTPSENDPGCLKYQAAHKGTLYVSILSYDAEGELTCDATPDQGSIVGFYHHAN